jgi:hypothetical protein
VPYFLSHTSPHFQIRGHQRKSRLQEKAGKEHKRKSTQPGLYFLYYWVSSRKMVAVMLGSPDQAPLWPLVDLQSGSQTTKFRITIKEQNEIWSLKMQNDHTPERQNKNKPTTQHHWVLSLYLFNFYKEVIQTPNILSKSGPPRTGNFLLHSRFQQGLFFTV